MESATSKGIVRLTYIGLAMSAIYLVYVIAFPLISNTQAGGPAADLEILMRGHRWLAPIYTLGILLLYYLFWKALQLARSMPGPGSTRDKGRTLVLAFGLFFGFTLVWLYPITANDLFRYVLRGRIWAVYGDSPMLSPPNDFLDDPYIAFAGEFGDWTSGYGPVWEMLVQVRSAWALRIWSPELSASSCSFCWRTYCAPSSSVGSQRLAAPGQVRNRLRWPPSSSSPGTRSS